MNDHVITQQYANMIGGNDNEMTVKVSRYWLKCLMRVCNHTNRLLSIRSHGSSAHCIEAPVSPLCVPHRYIAPVV